jgi:tRNA (guanine37-N1)-methyltransferase
MLTPAGQNFDQNLAYDLAKYDQLIFACGRYEGIDQRVTDYYRLKSEIDVIELSIGNYVLNGGEVAALAVTEAVVRLLPGVIGNPESLAQESHTLPGLEYPNYTKPPLWRGLAVPEILLSGNHGKIEMWRKEQAEMRTNAIHQLNLGNNPDTPTVH